MPHLIYYKTAQYVEFIETDSNRWRWRVVGNGGEILANGKELPTKQAALDNLRDTTTIATGALAGLPKVNE